MRHFVTNQHFVCNALFHSCMLNRRGATRLYNSQLLFTNCLFSPVTLDSKHL